MSGGGGGGSKKAVQYSWNGSAVSKMVVSTNISGQSEAAIYASPNVDSGALSQLTAQLSSKGMGVYFDEINGEQVLKVQSFSNPNVLLNTLAKTGVVQGNAAREELKNESENKGALSWVRENGVNAAGAFGVLGHIGLFSSGLIGNDPNRMRAAMMYGGSDSIFFMFGAGEQKQVSALCAGLQDYLQADGINFTQSEHVTPTQLYQSRSVAHKGFDAFKKHTIPIANSLGAFGNASTVMSAHKLLATEGAVAAGVRAGNATLNLTGAGIASFVPETTAEEREYKERMKAASADVGGEEKPLSVGGKMYDTLQKSPLAFQGATMFAMDAFQAFDARQIQQRYKRRLETDKVDIPDIPDAEKLGGPKSKEFRKANKEYDAAYKKAAHWQRLEEKYKQMEGLLEERPAREELKSLLKIDKLPDAKTCASMVENMDTALAKDSKLGKLINEEKMLLQEVIEVQKYPKGWMFAGLQAGAWLTAATFRTLSSKNKAQEVDVKYGEIFANVATMALEVPVEQRAEMIHKSAGYLAAQEAVFITSEEVEEGITKKLAALEKSPWHDAAQQPVIFADAEPNTHVAEAARHETLVAAPHAGAQLN